MPELATIGTLSGDCGRESLQSVPEVPNNQPSFKIETNIGAESIVIPGGEIYQNLSIPVAELPVYIQRMKEKEYGFQKEFEVFVLYLKLLYSQ